MRIRLKILHEICFLLLLGSGGFPIRGLTVTGKDVSIEALRGEDVTIPCLLSAVPIPLNLQKLSVVWTLKLQNGTEYEVYHFHDSHHQSRRPGSRMNDRDLEEGNAGFYIPNIQITDEGEYICSVMITPDAGSATSTLHVSVKPQATLNHMRSVASGYLALNLFCEVSNFYPKAEEIRWNKYSINTGTKSSLDKDVSRTMPLRNSDGTFNVTSMLTVWPSFGAKPGDILSCIVNHRSLKEEITLSFPVPRRIPVMDMCFAWLALTALQNLTVTLNCKGWRLWIVVFRCAIYISIILLLCFLIYFTVDIDDVGVWIYIVFFCTITLYLTPLAYYAMYLWTYFTIGDLSVSKISGGRRNSHMERTTLTCQITDFRQKQIQINVYLKRRRDIKKHLIASWKPPDWISSNNTSNGLEISPAEDQHTNNSDVLSPLEEGAEPCPLLPVKMEVEMTKSWTGIYKCLCSITITPSADTDDGATLAVEVGHITLKQLISVRRTLYVYSTVVGIPVVSEINGDTWIPHMERTTLSFHITGFRTKDIYIHLYLKRRNDIENRLIHSWVSMDRPLGDNTAAGHQNGDPIEEDPLLGDTVIDTTLPMEMKVEMTETEDGSYECDCRISLTLNADTDDGAVLTVEVDHAALKWPVYVYKILNVIKGDKPSLWRRCMLLN